MTATISKGHLVTVPADPAWNSGDDSALAIVTKVWADGSDGKNATIGVRIIADNNQNMEWRTVVLLDAAPDTVPGEPVNYGIAWPMAKDTASVPVVPPAPATPPVTAPVTGTDSAPDATGTTGGN